MAEESKSKTFFIRLRSSVIITAATIALVVFGGIPLLFGVSIISIIGLMELYRVLGFHKTPLAIVMYILAAFFEVMIYVASMMPFVIYSIFILLFLIVLYVLSYPKYKAEQLMGAFFGFFYVIVLLSFIYITRIEDCGAYLVWYIFISAWGADTLAYCGGMLFGKHKMTPVLSPKKTIEGAICGVLGAALLGFIFSLIFKSELSEVLRYPLIMGPVICGVCGAISIIGDLAASAIKRNYDVKDYGNLIPGHGGILDRFDSIIITAPAVFFMVAFLGIFS